MTEINASTGSVVNTITVGSDPFGIASDGTDVWVANYNDNTVSELDASTGSVIDTIPVGSGPAGLCSHGTDAWVANSGSDTVSQLAG